MKLKDVAKGTWAIKPVPLRLANAVEAAQPGQPPSAAPVIVTVGVRVLTGAETEQVYEKAASRAREKGVAEWKDEHPICKLALMAFTLAIACVDFESDHKKPDGFFDSVDDVFESKHVGTDNIVYLYERYQDWQDACSIERKNMSADEVIATALQMVEAPEGADSPLDLMRPGLRKSFTRTLAVLLLSSLDRKSPSGSPGDSSTGDSKNSPPSSAEAPPSEA